VSDGISLGAGNTPLVRSGWIGPALGLQHLYFKLEQTNPTGSYKDRFAARLVSLLVAGGHRLCLGTSSGNAGAAMAAFSAAAGIRCVLCVPENAPTAKLTQIQAYGAHLLRVPGMVDSPATLRALFERLREITLRREMPLGVSAYALSPEAMAGIEPLSGEVNAALGAPPDRVFVPVGGGGLLLAIWRGFVPARPRAAATPPEHVEADVERAHWRRAADGGVVRLPRIHAVQPHENDTVVSALHAGEAVAREVTSVTAISGLGVPLDLDATRALAAVRDSGGDGHLVETEWVLEIQSHLARREGLYVEPAGAVSVAGLWRAAQAGQIRSEEHVVCLLTGHGFKDEAAARQMAEHTCNRSERVLPEQIDGALLDRLEGSSE
jgi:threonine synthase